MQNKNTLIVIIVLLLLAGGAYWAYSQDYFGTAPGDEGFIGDEIIEESLSDDDVPSNEPDNIDPASGTELMEASMVRAHVAQQLRVSPDDVMVLAATPQEWPDGCLGLGGAGEMCTQAIVPGFEVVVEVNGEVYTYRTNMEASVIVEDRGL